MSAYYITQNDYGNNYMHRKNDVNCQSVRISSMYFFRS